jgi:hypothetical protein
VEQEYLLNLVDKFWDLGNLDPAKYVFSQNLQPRTQLSGDRKITFDMYL